MPALERRTARRERVSACEGGPGRPICAAVTNSLAAACGTTGNQKELSSLCLGRQMSCMSLCKRLCNLVDPAPMPAIPADGVQYKRVMKKGGEMEGSGC